MGGCFAAKFLRENGGKNLDIRVFAKKGSKIGGRVAVCQFDGHSFEAGALIIHSENKYLVEAAKQHGIMDCMGSVNGGGGGGGGC